MSESVNLKEQKEIHSMRKPEGIAFHYIKDLLQEKPDFTGNLQLNFRDGELMDINKTERTKF
jgi:hypothetical protein